MDPPNNEGIAAAPSNFFGSAEIFCCYPITSIPVMNWFSLRIQFSQLDFHFRFAFGGGQWNAAFPDLLLI
jgi:hypothetical protein